MDVISFRSSAIRKVAHLFDVDLPVVVIGDAHKVTVMALGLPAQNPCEHELEGMTLDLYRCH